ncbi:MAG: twin-arginine translocase TatA/TatE family subunit [Firmicutes bacterium]|nr:twin-arginine translocase TatA/TatE family subunit [Bacillota bacterium]
MGDLLSPVHLGVLLVLVLIIFGPKRLPELGKSIGETVRMLRDVTQNSFSADEKKATGSNRTTEQ